MSRKKKGPKTVQSKAVHTPKKQIDSDALEDIISNAILRADIEAAEKKREEDDAMRREWRKKIGLSDNNSTPLRDFCALIKIFLHPKDYLPEGSGLSLLLSTLLSVVFEVFKLFFYLLMCVLIYGMCKMPLSILTITAGILAFGCLLIARMFRMASLDVDRIQDSNTIITVFSAFVAFISMCATLLSFFIIR